MTGPFQIERQQPRQNIVIAQVIRPAIGGKDGGIEFLVDVVEPGGALVVEVGEGGRHTAGECSRADGFVN